MSAAKGREHKLSIHCEYYAARGATLVTVIGSDHPGLFYRIAGAIHLAGGNIIDARIHTTRVGMALDNFLVQDPLGRPFREESQLERLTTAIEDALANRIELVPQLAKRPLPHARAASFRSAPAGLFRQQGLEPLHRDRSQRARPAGAAQPPGAGHVRKPADGEFGAYHHITANARRTLSTSPT